MALSQQELENKSPSEIDVLTRQPLAEPEWQET